MAIPEVLAYLERIKSIHEKKIKDYAAATNQFENFERSAELMSWFDSNLDKAFVSLIGTKLARLATLLGKNESPNNESIDDSFLDLMTYCILWNNNYSRRTNQNVDSALDTLVYNLGPSPRKRNIQPK